LSSTFLFVGDANPDYPIAPFIDFKGFISLIKFATSFFR